MSFNNYLLPSTDFEQACNIAVNAIKQAKEKALTAVENLKGADLLPMKVEPCTLPSIGRIEGYRTTHKYPYNRSNAETAAAALAVLNNDWSKITAMHSKNLEALENNKKAEAAIVEFMKRMSISTSYDTYEFKTSRSRNSTKTTHKAGWVQDCARVLKTSDHFEGCERVYNSVKLEIEEWLKVEEKKARIKEAAEKEDSAKKALLGEAIEYLFNHDKKINEDFNPDDAIEVANDLASELYIQELTEAGEYISFSGSYSCEDCQGWLPGEHRCQCGNHRVSFVNSDWHTFKDPSVHAEAY